MKTLFVLASLILVLFLAAPNKIEAQKRKAAKIIEGTISNFECGDNCYLTIADENGKEHRGLCNAPLCNSWVALQMMPDSYKGKRVKVTIGKGKQYNASGHVMGTMNAFTRIQLLTAPTSIPRNPQGLPNKAQNSTVNSATNFQGKYQANTRFSTANNTYSGTEQLTIKKATSDTYDWTLEVRGYQTFYIIYGTCKAENNIAECNLSGLKDGYFFGEPDDIERIKNSGSYFTLKMDGTSLLTKWAKVWGETDDPQYKGFIRYFKRVLSFK